MKQVTITFEINGTRLKSATVLKNETDMDDITAMKSLSMALYIGLTRHEDDCLDQAVKIINRK